MPLSTPIATEIREISICPSCFPGDSVMVSLYEDPRTSPILNLLVRNREQATNLIYALEEAARRLTRELNTLEPGKGSEIPCATRRGGEFVARRGLETEVAA